MQKYDTTESQLQRFTEDYLIAQRRADFDPTNGGKLFRLVDKIQLVEKLSGLLKSDPYLTYHSVGKTLALADKESEGDVRTLHQRHASRIRGWATLARKGNLCIENAISVSKQHNNSQDDISKFKKNLIDSVKAICSSGFKNYLSEDEINIILNSGLITAKEELKVAQFKSALHSFMREHGINKEVALQILEA